MPPPSAAAAAEADALAATFDDLVSRAVEAGISSHAELPARVRALLPASEWRARCRARLVRRGAAWGATAAARGCCGEREYYEALVKHYLEAKRVREASFLSGGGEEEEEEEKRSEAAAAAEKEGAAAIPEPPPPAAAAAAAENRPPSAALPLLDAAATALLPESSIEEEEDGEGVEGASPPSGFEGGADAGAALAAAALAVEMNSLRPTPRVLSASAAAKLGSDANGSPDLRVALSIEA